MRSRAPIFGIVMTMMAMLCAAASSDGRPKPIDGVYAVGTTNVDPGPNDLLDSHFIVHLRESTARDLYEAMKVPAEQHERACEGPDALVKRIGGMTCSHYPERSQYLCNFAIDIANQSVDGLSC
jgi:hypothetical protein